jgi:hypothetical protein
MLHHLTHQPPSAINLSGNESRTRTKALRDVQCTHPARRLMTSIYVGMCVTVTSMVAKELPFDDAIDCWV